jgi:hypothetical protein
MKLDQQLKFLEKPGTFSKILFLQEMRNKFGPCKVTTRFPDGRWSKHIDVLDIWQNPKELWRLETANNRSLLIPEVVLDYDPPKGSEQGETLLEAKKIADKLKDEGFSYKVFFSGSRGYHFHLIFPRLVFCSDKQRREFRTFMIKRFDCDLSKLSEGTMIALENTPHWKTGNTKREVLL